MFSQLDGWDYLILASDKNSLTGGRVYSQPGLLAIPVNSHSSNGLRRIASWMIYAERAVLLGLRQGAVDVVYASSPHLLAGLAGWIIASVKRAPLVIEIRDLWPSVLVEMGQISENSLAYKALRLLEERLYKHAQAIVVLAPGARTGLLRRGIPAAKLHVIPNAADPEDFRPSEARSVLRRRYGFDRCTFLYAGAHGPANGLDLLLSAASDLREQAVDIVLVGGGVCKDALRAEVEKQQLRNVRFLDSVPKREVPDLLAAADVGLHVLADVPIFREAVSPNKVFDYMAAGLPIVTNSPGVVGDLVASANCGLISEPGGLECAISEMLNAGPDARRTLGASGRAWIAANQSRQAMVNRLGRTLTSVVAKPLKGSR